jgi:type VI protein secretion system component Hcp
MSGWSNMFMQLVTGLGPVPAPVLGEGLLQGWEGSIELLSFDWDAEYKEPDTKSKKGGSLLSGLASAAASLIGVADDGTFNPGELTFKKRFDIASAQIHTALDNGWPVISCSITVLNIKQKGRAIHEPGFTLVATDGLFISADLSASGSGNSCELVETVKMSFQNIVITYLKRTGKDNVPTNPFFFNKAKSA